MTPFLILSLFLTEPVPLDMPLAEGYHVREDAKLRLEDRFSRQDLWVSQTVTGRWLDEEDRQFVLARLATRPPSAGGDKFVTRREAAEESRPMDRLRSNHGIPLPFREAVEQLSYPCPVVEHPREPRQLPRGYKAVYYWQHPTNLSTIVCTFLPERTNVWQLATWQLAGNDDYATQIEAFEDQFLRREFPAFDKAHPATFRSPASSERELLRADARHSVAAYDAWHVTEANEFVVLDNLPEGDFVTALTNEFPVLRARYAAALPTPLDAKDALCVARIFSDRAEYLEALTVEGLTNMTWSAAYWSPVRRELVAYLPPRDEERLLKTFRHEAFHQYLSYATAMIPVSPWLNEGYAQYFESGDEEPFVDPADLTSLVDLVVPLLSMDYETFYSGTDRARALKYRLALSIVYFIEKGAPKVRFAPFKTLKSDYIAELLATRDMRKATAACFRNADHLKLFVTEWLKFWENQ